MYYSYFFYIKTKYMDESIINDKRVKADFKNLSFSKFSKSKIKIELLKSLLKNNIEKSIYLSTELICSGHFIDLWDNILLYMSRYIHISNPKLPIYIEIRFNKFKTILENGYLDNELELRNNKKIRILFSEIISVLCFSKKNNAFENLKIKDIQEFELINLNNRLKASNISFANKFFKEKDPKEIFIPINEFSFNISKDSEDHIEATFWFEWILQYETLLNKEKKKLLCETRLFANVDYKYQDDIIWIIWEIILDESKKKQILNKIIISLFNHFCIKYTFSLKKKRKYIIYYCIYLLTQPIDYNKNIIERKDTIDNIINNSDIIYKELKKNEEKPDMDYLFHGLEKSNLDKSINKLETLDKLFKNSY